MNAGRDRRKRRLQGGATRLEPVSSPRDAGDAQRRPHRDRLDLLLQRAARQRPTHRIGRLSRLSQSKTMTRAACAVLSLALLASPGRAAFAQPAPDLDPRIVQLVGRVSPDRLTAILRKLESFG